MRITYFALAVLLALTAACSGGGESPQPPAATSQPSPSATPAPTGVAAISEPVARLVAAVEAKDATTLTGMLRTITTPCTDRQGAGGPPKCSLGGRDTKGEGAPTPFPAGTPVEAFPISSCEFGWYDPPAARDLAQATLPSLGELIAVLRLTQPLYTATDATYPQAQYAAAFTRRASGQAERAIVYALDSSGVTLIDLPCLDDLRQSLERNTHYRGAEVAYAGPAAAKAGITPVPAPAR